MLAEQKGNAASPAVKLLAGNRRNFTFAREELENFPLRFRFRAPAEQVEQPGGKICEVGYRRQFGTLGKLLLVEIAFFLIPIIH
jgi:hypothetical protein